MSHAPHDAIVVRPGQDLVAVVAGLPNGSRVYLGNGIHALTGTLVISGKTGISIEGGPNAVLAYTLGGSHSIQVLSSSHVTFRGFRFVTNATTGASSIHDSSSVSVIDVTMEATAAGTLSAMLAISGTCSDVLVSGCFIYGLTQNTVRLDTGGGVIRRVKIVDCDLNSGSGSGLSNVDVFNGAGTLTDVVISNCTIRGGDHGIYVGNSSRVTIEGCVVLSTRGAGIYMTSSSSVTVVACIVDTTGREGVYSDGGGDDNVFGGCIARDSSAGFRVNGARTLIDACIVNTTREYNFDLGGSVQVLQGSIGLAAAYDSVRSVGGGQRVLNANIFVAPDYNGFTTTDAQNNLLVANCIFFTNGAESLLELNAGVSDSLVCGNIIYRAARRAVLVNNGTRVSIQGNIFSLSGLSHVRIEGGSNFCACTSNILWENATNSAIDNADSPNTQFRANIIYSAGSGTGDNGFWLNGSATVSILIEACLITPRFGRAIFTPGGMSGRVTVAGVIALGPSGAGQTIISTGSNASVDFVVVDSIAINSSNYGFSIQSTRGQMVGSLAVHTGTPANMGFRFMTANPCAGIIAYCMSKSMTGGAKIEGNLSHYVIRGSSFFLSTTNGIFINGADEGVVSGCRCAGNTSNGIQEDAGSDQNLYAECHLRGNGVATNFNGTNRTAADNKV